MEIKADPGDVLGLFVNLRFRRGANTHTRLGMVIERRYAPRDNAILFRVEPQRYDLTIDIDDILGVEIVGPYTPREVTTPEG